MVGFWGTGVWELTPAYLPVWLHGDPLARDHVVGRGGGLPAPSCCYRSSLLSAGQLGGTLTQNSCLLLPQWLTVAVGLVGNSSASAVFLLLRVGQGELTAGGRGAGGREYWLDSRWPLCKLTPRLVVVGTFLLTLPLWSCGLLAPGGPLPFALLPVHPPLLSTELVRMVLNG